jgi:hypothetical protein
MNTIGGGANAPATLAGTTNGVSGTQYFAQLFWGQGANAAVDTLIAVTNPPAKHYQRDPHRAAESASDTGWSSAIHNRGDSRTFVHIPESHRWLGSVALAPSQELIGDCFRIKAEVPLSDRP